jgi:hypothetical protein
MEKRIELVRKKEIGGDCLGDWLPNMFRITILILVFSIIACLVLNR